MNTLLIIGYVCIILVGMVLAVIIELLIGDLRVLNQIRLT